MREIESGLVSSRGANLVVCSPLLSCAGRKTANGVRHNQPGGLIAVTIGVEGPAARLVVESGGVRLDPEKVDRLADPFRHLGADRTGSDNGVGLGLSIVAAIAAAHGGTLELRARAEGGLRLAIELPRQTASGNGDRR